MTTTGGNTENQKPVNKLAASVGVPNEILLKLLRERGVELRNHLSLVSKDDFLAVKDTLMAEKAKLDSRAKAQATKKAIASKTASNAATASADDSDAVSVKEVKGARVILKKGGAEDMASEEPTAPASVTPAQPVAVPEPVVAPKVVSESLAETPAAPAPVAAVVSEPVTPETTKPAPVAKPAEVVVAEGITPKSAPIDSAAQDTKSTEVPAPKVAATKDLAPTDSASAKEPVAQAAAPVATPAQVESTEVAPRKPAVSQMKATIEGPRADVLARIEKSRLQAQQAQQARNRPRPTGPGYTGAFGRAPAGAAPGSGPGDSRGPGGPGRSSAPRTGGAPGGAAPRGGRNTAMQDAFGAVNPRDLPQNSSSPAGRSGGPGGRSTTGGPGGGKKGGAANKKGGGRNDKRKEQQVETVRQNVSRVMASLSKTPVRKTYRKEINADSSDESRKIIKVSDFISVGELAGLMDQMPAKVIAKCMEMGMMVTINHRVDFETIQVLADEFGFDVELMEEYGEEVMGIEEQDDPSAQVPRAPVVTVMGHVDHGKTSLLDWVRKENVVAGESGGITQHVGAYEVVTPHGHVTFLDTPGHEAFTAMRARGSQVTDVIVLVVASDSMVMPQTLEVIELARNAKVPLVVAITKVDLPTSNPDKIRTQLSERGVEVEQWGGNVSCVEVSSKTGAGMDRLLEVLALETEVLELKANPESRAKGVVIESQLDRGKGSLATVLIQNGTLRVGDIYVCGNFSGRVRAMLDERGRPRAEAGPSTPCVVLGFDGTPQAGDDLVVFADEKTAREIASNRRMASRERELRFRKNMSLEQVFDRVKSGESAELNLIIKADVDGSAEALAASLEKVSNREVKVKVIRKAVGAITESDILLASTADAIIIAFHLLPSPVVREMAEREGVQIRTYRIIYEAIEEVQGVAEGLLKPTIREEVVGEAEIREVFKIPKVGLIAGCMVKSGEVNRDTQVRVYREGVEVGLTKVQSLKRHKDDASSVKMGMECGIGLKGFEGIQEGDILAFFKQISVARKMSDVKEEAPN